MACYPLAAPISNPRALLATVVGIFIIAFAASQLLDLLLDDPFEAKRFSIEEMAYGKSSASGRVANVLILYREWVSTPTALFTGLGYGAFSYFSESAGEPYSHVLFADAVFELGLPGAVFMGVFVWTSTSAGLKLLRSSKDEPVQRTITALLVGWFAYEILLVNKQGALWGVASVFTAGAIMARLAAREHSMMPVVPPAGGLASSAIEFH
jgi:hypothetical protein